jgi:uncharacterized protein
LDVAAFCRDGSTLQSSCALPELPRLADSVIRLADGSAEPPVEWQAAGSMQREHGGEPQCVVALKAQARVTLQCQRCLQPLVVPLVVARNFRFVRGEDEAARQDEEAGDEEDVLALAARFDFLGLVEDELLLALPIVPRHEACGLPADAAVAVPAAGQGVAQTSHRPFAKALASWRGGKPGD